MWLVISCSGALSCGEKLLFPFPGFSFVIHCTCDRSLEGKLDGAIERLQSIEFPGVYCLDSSVTDSMQPCKGHDEFSFSYSTSDRLRFSTEMVSGGKCGTIVLSCMRGSSSISHNPNCSFTSSRVNTCSSNGNTCMYVYKVE